MNTLVTVFGIIGFGGIGLAVIGVLKEFAELVYEPESKVES